MGYSIYKFSERNNGYSLFGSMNINSEYGNKEKCKLWFAKYSTIKSLMNIVQASLLNLKRKDLSQLIGGKVLIYYGEQ